MSKNKSKQAQSTEISKKQDGIYDAKTLGNPKVAMLGLQHMFAMFGATVLVPMLTGLDVSTTLLFAGLGTLLFHFLTKRKVPAFLGSSFAFLAGYFAIAPNGERELLPYACLGVAAAGLLYLLMALLIKVFGQKKVLKFFPPIVTGPIIIAIGLTLSGSAIDNCSGQWGLACIAIAVVVLCNIFGKGMIKIIPIILGTAASYIVAVIMDLTLKTNYVDVESIKNAAWVGLPVDFAKDSVYAVFANPDKGLIVTAIITIMPIALATIIEHIGDISAISSTTGINYVEDPGLHRTLLGDGLATIVASLCGAPANTTYGENTGVLSLTKVFDPRVVRIAAYMAILFSFSPKFAAVIHSIPVATGGGISLVLYGMISAVGVRNVVENQIDFSKARNIIVAALILGLSVGIKYSTMGSINITIGSMTIPLSGLAVGAFVGIILNALLPFEKETAYEGVKKDMKSEDDSKSK